VKGIQPSQAFTTPGLWSLAACTNTEGEGLWDYIVSCWPIPWCPEGATCTGDNVKRIDEVGANQPLIGSSN